MSNNIKNIPALTSIFSGNIYVFYAFDIGDDIDLEAVKQSPIIQSTQLNVPKYFKNYHVPLEVELPHPNNSSKCLSVKLHQFGAVSFTYKIPFTANFKDMKQLLIEVDEKFQQQSVDDANLLFKKLKPFIIKPRFFHHKAYYPIVQVNVNPDFSGKDMKEQYGEAIASLVRFETETLSDFQKQAVLNESLGYYKQDFTVIDSEASFVYDPHYEELLNFFELINIQLLEVQYFDKLLDKQLTVIYEQSSYKLPLMSYLPFIGSQYIDPVGELNKLKVDISVITERLENSIKLAGEVYFSAIYEQLTNKLEIEKWRTSIDKKLDIIKDMRHMYQDKIDANREDLLSVLIIILIVLELAVAMTGH